MDHQNKYAYGTILFLFGVLLIVSKVTTIPHLFTLLYEAPYVILDAGHGGSDPGSPEKDAAIKCDVPLDIHENFIAIDFTKRVTEILVRNDVRVGMTHDDDCTMELLERTYFIG